MDQVTEQPVKSRAHYVLAAICLAALVLPLSFTGGAVATPAIGADFNANPVALAWVTNAFMLSFGSLLMAAGTLSDIYGRKRLFTAGLGMFFLVSILLANVTSIVWLDILRAVQGIAAAAALSSGSAALAQEFEGHSRTKAFSILGTTFGLGLAFGPMVSGMLVEAFGWRSIFVCTAILAGVSLLGAFSQMNESRNSEAQRLDLPGVVSFSVTLVAFTTAIILGPQQGWTSFTVACLFATALIGVAAFCCIELKVEHPMLQLSLLKYPRFLGVQMLPLGTCYCYIVLIVLLPFRLLGIEAVTPLQSGFMMLALSAPMLVVPLIAAWLTKWISAGALSAIGFLIAAAGLCLLASAGVGEHQMLAIGMLVIGVGTGLPWGLMDGLAISVVPKERAGMAAGIFNTTRVAGEGVALAITVACLTSFVGANLVGQPAASRLAQKLVMGDLNNIPNSSIEALRRAYESGFNSLLFLLVAFTLLSAGASYLLLGGNRNAAEANESGSSADSVRG